MNGHGRHYRFCNSDAHRNIPTNIHAPSLVWHRAFWIKQPNNHEVVEEAELVNVFDVKITKAKQYLDRILIALYGDLRGALDETGVDRHNILLSPQASGKLVLFDTIVDMDSLISDDYISNHNFSDPADKLASDQGLYNECLNQRRHVRIEFAWRGIKIHIRCEWHTEYFTITTFAELHPDKDNKTFSRHDALNTNIVALLDYLKSEQTYQELKKDNEKIKKLNKIKRYFFSDFWHEYYYGLIYQFANTKCEFDAAKAELFDGTQFADFRIMILSDHARPFEDKEFFSGGAEPRWGIPAKEKYLPLLNVDQNELAHHECAINYMLNGRAFYISSLAPKAAMASGNAQNPVETIIHVRQIKGLARAVVNEWEIGRLVNQINLVGTLRLAALINVPLLRKSGMELHAFEPIGQKARDSVFNSDPDRLEFLRKAQQAFNRVTKGFKDTNDGLAYRVERSRYYTRQWQNAVSYLDIKKIEGDQSYEEFVRRRLGAEFDFVDRIGHRYQRAGQTLLLIIQEFIGAELYRIQVGAEIALFCILIPYYTLGILSYFVSQVWMPYLAVGIWAVSGWKGVKKAVHELFLFKESTAKIWAWTWVLIIPVAFIAALYRDEKLQHLNTGSARDFLHLPQENDDAAQKMQLKALNNIKEAIDGSKSLSERLSSVHDELSVERKRTRSLESSLESANSAIQQLQLDLQRIQPDGKSHRVRKR